ncbi:MAG: DUF4332 domain-containing protein [Myxococcales bacterium]|nr:DUF4332 domain-containing protein [Myxococcales bacterium]MCB9520581.1 DUF4332 domain-containing protein [Myxococcales bacterium]MCB9531504.1 DUF4332 domain-containing protein [Myxococcales bacterium]
MKLIRSALGFLLVAAFSPAAYASHYRLPDVTERFSPALYAELERLGYETTADVLRNVDTADDRRALASVTGASLGELTELARMCEFLQIDGVGPRAYDLLVAGGVQDLEDLAGRDAAQLQAELVAVNAAQRVTGVDPEVALVQHWITEASSAAIRVEY